MKISGARIFLVLLVCSLAFFSELLLDIFVGDGDGLITKPGLHTAFTVIRLLSILFFLYALLTCFFTTSIRNTGKKITSKVLVFAKYKPKGFMQRSILLVFGILTLFLSVKFGNRIPAFANTDPTMAGILNCVILLLKYFLILLSFYVVLIKAIGISVKTLIINFTAILCILYVFEFYLYKTDVFLKLPFDSGYYYRGRFKYSFMQFSDDPLHPYITWGHKTRINNFGYRAPDFTEKKDSTFRIAVFGDSFTWGAGLAENERYSEKLDSICKLHYKNIEVINCGLSGAPTITERDSIRNLIKKLEADMVIVGFCVNDPLPIGQDYSVERDEFNKKYSERLDKLQQTFSSFHLHYLGAGICKAWENIALRSGKIPPLHVSMGRAYDKTSKDWKDFAQALKDIKASCDDAKCAVDPVLIIFRYMGYIDFDMEGRTEAGFELLKAKTVWFKQVYEAGVEAKMITIDTHAEILNEMRAGKLKNEELAVSPLDGHPSGKLNTVYAVDLFKTLKPKFDSCTTIKNLLSKKLN